MNDNKLNKDDIIESMRSGSDIFYKLTDGWINDKDVLLEAIERHENFFEFAHPLTYVSENLRNDKEVALFAVRRMGIMVLS